MSIVSILEIRLPGARFSRISRQVGNTLALEVHAGERTFPLSGDITALAFGRLLDDLDPFDG